VSPETRDRIIKTLTIVATVYFFLLSINLLGHSFKLFGKGFAEAMLTMTSNPIAGLLIGIVATSLIQSSSTTTSLVVGMVAGGAVTLENAIPIVMGANIGTTITNTLVSLGHVSNRIEFRRAFGAGIVHDFFNIFAVLLLFPLEMKFHMIQKTAVFLEGLFAGAGGLKAFNPLKAIMNPAIDAIDWLVGFLPYSSYVLMVVSIIGLFTALTFLIRTIRAVMVTRIEQIINDYLFKNDLLGFIWGIGMTLVVQSSSVTTSLIVPLAGAGVVNLRQIFPYTLGANIGTTGTAILAALATQNHIAVTVAFAHLVFNVFGIVLLYPLRFIPIRTAEFVARKASESTRNLVAFIGTYLLLYIIPIILIIMS
jgi:sodium-dependent phosphate cotransporter